MVLITTINNPNLKLTCICNGFGVGILLPKRQGERLKECPNHELYTLENGQNLNKFALS